MPIRLQMQKVIPCSNFLETVDESVLGDAEALILEAKEYLEFFNWCKAIREVYVGMLIEGILGVFLFKISPAREEVDPWVWVIVGDLPPAYITVEDSPNPATALEAYIGAMEEWVEAAKHGKSVAKLIPVNIPASIENSGMLKSRLQFIEEKILCNFQDDLKF